MMLRLFLVFWSLAWVVSLPFVLAYLAFRGRRDPLYGRHIAERFGRHPKPMPGAFWIHAVSLGEMRSAVPLIKALLDRGEKVVTTHFTPAGRRECERVFRDEIEAGRVAAVWVPFELSSAYAGFFSAFRPRAGLVMEIEIWPKMIFASRKANVPIFMCNAQYPKKSLARDSRFGLRQRLMQHYDGALVKSDLQAERFASVGVKRIHVTGELRFDQPVSPHLIAAAERARPAFSGERPVITFASVVEGEDDIYLDAIESTLRHPSRPFIVYVPRKPERFEEVAGILARRGFNVIRRSAVLNADLSLASTSPFPDGQPAPDILLGDSLGEMYFYIALADRVVTGGGFLPSGAHNIIEPLALKRPVIVGPEIGTIEYPAVEAIGAGVCLRVETGEALGAALTGWAGPTDGQIEAFFTAHSGATARTLAAIDQSLTSR